MCAWQNLGLAVRAFGELLESLRQGEGGPAAAPGCVLVLAGGYDKRLAENREHFVEVQRLVADLGLQEQVRPDHAIWLAAQSAPLRIGKPTGMQMGSPYVCYRMQPHIIQLTCV